MRCCIKGSIAIPIGVLSSLDETTSVSENTYQQYDIANWLFNHNRGS